MKNGTLFFRKISVADFDFLKSILQDKNLMLLGWGKIYNDAEVEGWINKILQQYDKYGYSYFIVEDSSNEKLIGIAGIIKTTIDSVVLDEIAYIVKKEFQGLSYGTKIVQELINLSFDKYNFQQIIVQFVSENVASQKVLEKNGFIYDFSYQRDQNGILKDHSVYQLKNEMRVKN